VSGSGKRMPALGSGPSIYSRFLGLGEGRGPCFLRHRCGLFGVNCVCLFEIIAFAKRFESGRFGLSYGILISK
jgi:hypothetical protein